MARPKAFDESVALEKAMELFWQQGYHATSYGQLVAHMGVNRASLYSTFGDKQALFDKAVKQYTAQNLTQLKAFFETQSSVIAGLKKMVVRSLEEDLKPEGPKGCFVVNTATELQKGDEATLKRLLDHKELAEAVMADFIKGGQEKGEITQKQSAQQLAEYVFALYGGVKVMVKLKPERAYLTSILDTGLRTLVA
ncbi:MAG: TetR/AcrR family transcriptional regulator [Bacteroidota bacterium]